jgi:hypothetical protein
LAWQQAVMAGVGVLFTATATAAWASEGPSDPAAATDGGGPDCVASAERAQVLRGEGKLLQAAAELRTCLRASCPTFVREDCAKWSSEIETSIPTVVLRAHDGEGHELVAVRVSVDGLGWLSMLDGLAKPLDPGPHRLRFERSGSLPLEEEVVLHEGEKLRPIDADWPPSPRPVTQGGRAWPWLLGAFGVAALGAGAVVSAIGLSDYQGLEQSCGRTRSCSPSEVDAQRTRLWVGNVSLAAGVVAVGASAWILLTPSPAGPAVRVGGRF